MIVIFLSTWLIPILIIGICMYIDMEKGQSIEEYIKEQDIDSAAVIIIIAPVINCVTAFCCTILVIYNKIKHFRK